MNRLFGAKQTGPRPTLSSAIQNTDSHAESLDVKLSKINAELTTLQQKMSRMRDGPGKSAIKSKCLKLLQRRKQYEAQRDQYEQQSWNLSQASMMTDNLKNTMTTVDVIKQTNKDLRKQFGKVDIDKLERMQDEMADLMEQGNDIQEAMGRSYDVPEEVDEAELDAELEALGDEAEMEGAGGLGLGMGIGAGQEPGFLTDEVPQFVDEPPGGGEKVKEAAG
ncbi:uncharacterized protein KY384_004326 [Bacidia gigantensis]|uniref:uncharacterized protein n=1 Tax=Bacidia gigantensis TaxID=2732470 RepID=UPI001D03F6A2|nr:uncharacterized protein KY384_004326 [Bacidia gigantensis]KAG8530969.1 hypothetical protein KY384_004326 [Bacidia gigantensis]